MGGDERKHLTAVRDELIDYSGTPEGFLETAANRLNEKTAFKLARNSNEAGENILAERKIPGGILKISSGEELESELSRLSTWFLDWVVEKYLYLRKKTKEDARTEFLVSLNRLLVDENSPRELMDSLAGYFEDFFSVQVAGIWLNKDRAFVQLYRSDSAQKVQPPGRYLLEDENTSGWRKGPFEHRDHCWLVISDDEGLAGTIAFSSCEEVFDREELIRNLVPLICNYLRRLEHSITTGRHELYELGDTQTLTKEHFETSHGLREVWQTIVETITSMFACDTCRLFLLEDSDRLTLKAQLPPGEDTDSTVKISEDPLIKSVIREEKAVLINNVPDQEQTVRTPGGVRSFLAIPFRYGEEVMGTVNLSSETADMYTREDLDKLTHFCDSLATVYHNTAEFANLTGYVDELLANLPVGVINIEADSDNVFLNDTAREILGIAGEGIEYKDFVEYLKELEAENFLQFVRRRRAEPGEEVCRVELKTDGSHSRYISVSSTVIKDISGQVTGVLFVLTDITEQHLLNKQVNRQERLAALGELASSLAHEIKNPITSIIGFAQLIPRRLDDREFIKKMARIVERESERLNSLVENLLSFGRPQMGSRLEVEISNLIEDITALTGKRLEKQDVEVELDIEEDLTVYGDPVKLKQIFLNLVLNALDAMPEGGNLEIVGEEKNGNSYIRVIDTGEGIKEEDMNRIFNPFFTTKDEGTGLGLAITHRIIEEHGGEIQVDSTLGQGAEIQVKLPSNEEKAAPREEEIDHAFQN